MNQYRSFCTRWNCLIEQNLKMTNIGWEGSKNSALWQNTYIYWTNPTNSLPKRIYAVMGNIGGQIKC